MSDYAFPAAVVAVEPAERGDLLAAAFGAEWDLCAHEDRGDGVLVVVPSEVPKTVLVDVVAKFARQLESGHARVAVHTGEVHGDGNGYAGPDVDHVLRLVGSGALREASSRGCAVLVSDALYQSMARNEDDELDATAFHRTSVHVEDVAATAWLSVPDGEVPEHTFLRQVRSHPLVAALIALVLLSGVGWIAHKLLYHYAGVVLSIVRTTPSDSATSDDVPLDGTGLDGNRAPSTGGPPLRDPGLLVGNWQPSDKTGTKSFTGNSGACEGFFYDKGAVLDGGGPMTCVISSDPDSNGRFTLQVTRNPDTASYKIAFDSSDQATVYSSGGAEMYTIRRF
ncbi:MAG TPA: hypothetical protein VF821_15920 [Lentzea sp.]